MTDDLDPAPRRGWHAALNGMPTLLARWGRGLAALRRRRWAMRVLAMLLVLAVARAALWVTVERTLPSAESLLTYQPPLPTMVRGADGDIVYSYARERRVQLHFVDFPPRLIDAFLSAEDKSFWTHGGVDLFGLASAVVDYAVKHHSGERARGGSTITQQVAKNLLVGNEYSLSRKLREILLARRIESVLTKQQILELYLNAIPLGRQTFGVEAAARAYFDKDVSQLDLHQAAFLAILPKAPETYSRAQFESRALVRRNWVLDQMVRNGWATRDEADAAKAQPLGLMARRPDNYANDAGYFLEEVRRQLLARFGEKASNGPNSVYAGGLWVRTSLDRQLQDAAQAALREGLMRYAAGHPWHGPLGHVAIAGDAWQAALIGSKLGIHYQDWRVGIVVTRTHGEASVGFVDGSTGTLIDPPSGLQVGDVLAMAPQGSGRWASRIVPEVSGGMVIEAPQTGRVLAMQGGFDFRLGAFNRATQALRQPGSTIKPFVYATALDNGMTPASPVVDGVFCVDQGGGLGQKCFRNFDADDGGGTHTLRWGLEQSRNLMTVRIANDTGMDKVVHTIKALGIGDYPPFLAMALGAGDTTVLRMVNAYAALAAQGRQSEPSLIDYVQDRNGKVIWRADTRACNRCNQPEWDGQPMPRLHPPGHQVIDARTAYQTVHMLEGVVVRGTAATLHDLGLPLMGKTGTTTGPTNVWFVGGSPQIIGGVYLGYDQPRSLGGYAQGGRIAAPIFKQFVTLTRPRWSLVPFLAPPGVSLERIDRQSGERVYGGLANNDDPHAAVIWEAFKPDVETRRSGRAGQQTTRELVLDALRRARSARSGAAAAEADTQGGIF